jgi:hypothetical protein
MDDDNINSTGYTDEEDDEMMGSGTNRDVGDTSLDDTDDIERDDSI